MRLHHAGVWRVLFSVDVPRGVDGQALLPEDVWQPLAPAVQAAIVALAQQVVALVAEVRDLQARLGQTSTNSSRPPSSDPPEAPGRPPARPSGRSRGGQPGQVAHPRAVVPPERVDQIVNHRPTTCSHCAARVSTDAPSEGFVAHQVTELPPVRAVVIEHRLHRVVCPAGGEGTRAVLPAHVPAGAFGPGLQATVAVLCGQDHLSQRAPADRCRTLLDAPLASSSVAARCQQPAVALAGPVAATQATLPVAWVVNADETRWPRPQAGQTQWLWVVVTGLPGW